MEKTATMKTICAESSSERILRGLKSWSKMHSFTAKTAAAPHMTGATSAILQIYNVIDRQGGNLEHCLDFRYFKGKLTEGKYAA
jgi:hypothetical protein